MRCIGNRFFFMSFFHSKISVNQNASFSYKFDEKHTQNGLAYTPDDMQRMLKRGQPITSQMPPSVIYEGTFEQSNDVPLEFQRGVDPNDFYVAEVESHQKLSSVKRDYNKRHEFFKTKPE